MNRYCWFIKDIIWNIMDFMKMIIVMYVESFKAVKDSTKTFSDCVINVLFVLYMIFANPIVILVIGLKRLFK